MLPRTPDIPAWLDPPGFSYVTVTRVMTPMVWVVAGTGPSPSRPSAAPCPARWHLPGHRGLNRPKCTGARGSGGSLSGTGSAHSLREVSGFPGDTQPAASLSVQAPWGLWGSLPASTGRVWEGGRRGRVGGEERLPSDRGRAAL